MLSTFCTFCITKGTKKKSKVVITWSQLAGMKFYPVLLFCYKFFINYILWLHVKSFIPARRDPSFELLGSHFIRSKFSHVIASTPPLSGTKIFFKLISLKIPIEVHFNILKIFLLFLRCIWCQSVRKKVNICLCGILFYGSSHRRYSQGNICVGVFAGLQVCNCTFLTILQNF